MKARELGNIVLKTLGIYWFVRSMEYLLRVALLPFMGLEKIAGFNPKIEIISVILYASLFATISFFLIFRTDFLLRVLGIDEKGTGHAAASAAVTEYKTLAFTLLGLYFAVSALGKIMADLITLWLQWKSTDSTYGMFTRSFYITLWPDLMENIVKLIIGSALVTGRKRLTQLWKHLRPLTAARKGW